MTIEPIGNYVARWGEGPVASSSVLTYVDIEGRCIIEMQLADGHETVWPVGQRVGCVLPRRDSGWLGAGDHGFFAFDPESAACQPLVDPEAHLPDNRFNDGKCAPDGRAFAGSISLSRTPGTAALYRLDPDLSVTRVLDDLTNSNGMAWSLDGRSVYHIDTPRRAIRAFDYEDGALLNPRTVIDTAALAGVPDGMTIDCDGNLWVAFCHGSAVVQFDPHGGAVLRHIALPCFESTSVCFGGDNFATLFVTTGIAKDRHEPWAGRVLAIRGLGVRGQPAHCFAG
jgi:sugar lactone lactonase YvrE